MGRRLRPAGWTAAWPRSARSLPFESIYTRLNLRQQPRRAIFFARAQRIGVGVVAEQLGGRVEAQRASQSPGYVAGMAQKRRGMSDGFQIGGGRLAALDAVEEVADMRQAIVGARILRQHLMLWVVGTPGPI